MIVSEEMKMGQTESRARNRRRVGESDARHREVAVASNPVSSNATVRGVVTSSAPIVVDDNDDEDDVVLSSRRSFAHASPIVTSNAASRGVVTPIVVDDDDDEDDVVLSSPRSYAYALFKASLEHHRSTLQARVPVEEDTLELRLGPGHGAPEDSSWTNRTRQPHQGHQRRPARPTIDLTTPSRQAPVNDDCSVLHECTKSRKRKDPVALEPPFMTEIPRDITPVHKAEEYKLRCAICMETMKDETSTICGHIFCQSCIHGAIRAQKKCPTCRKKLTLKNVHRIYL